MFAFNEGGRFFTLAFKLKQKPRDIFPRFIYVYLFGLRLFKAF